MKHTTYYMKIWVIIVLMLKWAIDCGQQKHIIIG